MDNAFEEIFAGIQSDLKKNLEADERGELADGSEPKSIGGGGTVHVTFHLDSSGNYSWHTTKYGAGKTVSITAWIESPDAVYDVHVHSSDGGGGTWKGVKVNQQLHCKIKTSFWHKTKISLDLHANVTDKDGKGTIEYKY